MIGKRTGEKSVQFKGVAGPPNALPFLLCSKPQKSMSDFRKWMDALVVDPVAAKQAIRVHDLRRLHIPFTRIMFFPLNVSVVDGLLCEIAEIFAKHKVVFWLRDGTALGIYRDGTVLPHDDDADLGLWYEDLPAAEPAFLALMEHGFRLYRKTESMLAFLKNNETVEFCFSGLPETTEVYIKTLETFFRDLSPYTYRGCEFLIPAKTETYLEFAYGKTWRTPKVGAWLNSYWRGAKKRDAYTREFLENDK